LTAASEHAPDPSKRKSEGNGHSEHVACALLVSSDVLRCLHTKDTTQESAGHTVPGEKRHGFVPVVPAFSQQKGDLCADIRPSKGATVHREQAIIRSASIGPRKSFPEQRRHHYPHHRSDHIYRAATRNPRHHKMVRGEWEEWEQFM
jgi:hypothetical protein